MVRWSISKLNMESRLCHMGTHQHCDQRSETRNDNGHPGTGRRRPEWSEWAGGRWFFAVGPEQLWKTGLAPQRSFSFQVSTQFWYLCTLHWLSGRYQYQTERTGLNSTNTYKYCGYKYNIFLRGTASTATGAPTGKFDNENQRKQCEPGLGNHQASCTHTRTRINKLDFCKLGRHDLPYKWRKQQNAAIRISHGMEPTEDKNSWAEMQRHVLEDRLKLPNKLAKSSISVTLQALKKNIPCRCRDGNIPAERWFEVCTNQGPKENNFQLTQVGESKMLRPKPCQTLLTVSIRSYCHADVVVLLQYRRTFG